MPLLWKPYTSALSRCERCGAEATHALVRLNRWGVIVGLVRLSCAACRRYVLNGPVLDDTAATAVD